MAVVCWIYCAEVDGCVARPEANQAAGVRVLVMSSEMSRPNLERDERKRSMTKDRLLVEEDGW